MAYTPLENWEQTAIGEKERKQNQRFKVIPEHF